MLRIAGMLLLSIAALAEDYSIDSVSMYSGGGASINGNMILVGLIQSPPPATASVSDYVIVGQFLSVAAPLYEAVPEPAPLVETLYVSNASDLTITKFTTDGISSLFASTAPGTPYGLAFDRAGNLYVAVSGDKILRFTPEGAQSVFAETNLVTPTGLAFDGAGNLYVANNGDSTIAKFTPEGVGSVLAASGLARPSGLAFDGAGNLYVANGSSRIMKFTPEGVGSLFATTGAYPTGLAFDGTGNLYAANYHGYNIQKFTPEGSSSVFASILNSPWGLAFDRAGNLYVANSGNSIQKFKRDGTGSVFADTGLHSPTFIAFTHLPTGGGTPPTELRITTPERVGNELRVILSSLAGRHFEIESLTDLADPKWDTFPASTISSADGTVQITLPIRLDRSHQFYRVRLLP
jgi:sugar lactone lactonase YvrE